MAESASQKYDMDDRSMDLFENKTAIEETEEKVVEEQTVTYSEMTTADRPLFRWLKKMMIFGFISIFLGACIWQVNSLKKESQMLDQTMAQLEKQIEEEKAKELEIKVEKEYYQSIAYRERMARDRCKLIYPNEILITIQSMK